MAEGPRRPADRSTPAPDRDVQAGAPTPLDVALGELERRRRDRWIVGAVLVLAVVGALGVLLIDGEVVGTTPWAAGGFLAVAVVYGASVVVQERRAQRAVRALVEEREHLAALEARITALESLHEVVRGVVAAQDLPAVFERLLHGAIQLTGADSGTVLLRVGDTLTVAASDGPGAAERGVRVPQDESPAWEAVRGGEVEVDGRGAERGMAGGGATLAAPLHLPADEPSTDGPAIGRIVGVLVVERGRGAAGFAAADRLAASLFAQQAALAVRNTSRLDRAAERVAALGRERDEHATAIRTILDALHGHVSAVTGTARLLLHQGESTPPRRRDALLSSVLESVARQRQLLARLEQLSPPLDPTPDADASRDPRPPAQGR